jgi:hypothetical protein
LLNLDVSSAEHVALMLSFRSDVAGRNMNTLM